MKRYLRPATFLAVAAVFASAGLIKSAPPVATDWSSCSDDLARLKRAASDAEDKAKEAEEAADELEDKKRDYENCKRFPDVYDLLKDGCRSKRSDYESARSSYDSAVSDAESDLDTVASRVRTVNSSCETTMPAWQGPPTQGAGSSFADRSCALYRSYKGQLPLKDIMEVCLRSNTEAQCKKCLETK